MSYSPEQAKAYRTKNKLKMKEYCKVYYKNNKTKLIFRAKAYYEANLDKRLKQVKEWTTKNKVASNKAKAKWRSKNKKLCNLLVKEWTKRNSGRKQASGAKRRALFKNAVPNWLSTSQHNEIIKIYENRPKGFHVDHIVPLVNQNVCGLHVPWNLQVIPALDNYRKSNKF